jgi:glutamine synthetase
MEVRQMRRSFEAIEALIREKNIEMVDLKSLDLRGRMHHVSIPVTHFTPAILHDGVGFDGSSFGYSKVECSDMIQIPDIDTAVVDPFREIPTLSFFTKIHLTDKDRSRFQQDPRWVAEKAEQFVLDSGVGDKSWWGPEYEFYIFSEVEYDTRTSASFYFVNHEEEFHHNAYHACNPKDMYDDFRDLAVQLMLRLGIDVKYHHHEVGERGQQEIELMFNGLLKSADEALLTKYVLFNLARTHDLYVTFMPKPMFRQAGSGWHVHQFLTRQGKNIFFGPGEYANMNETGLFYIGGLLRHSRALSALTNPSTNSYKRLVPGFEAPVTITYGMANRSSAVRIPSYVSDPQKTRLEYRPPDATANPYLALSAMLMACLDGVINRIDPREEGFGPFDTSTSHDSTPDSIRFLPRSLDQAIEEIEKDHEFLLRGGVFSEDLLKRWLSMMREEIMEIATMPNPFEYKLYFDL